MYSNAIVKIERCHGAIEDEPEVDPFMDISSLRTRVKVEVFEGVMAHSSLDLKPELPIPPGQNDQVHPGEYFQIKMEDSEEAINPEISESSDEDEVEDSSSEEEDEPPTGKYKGVLFSDVMEEFTKKYQPIPSLLILLKNEPSLRFLPHFGSVRCEPCYLGSNTSQISSKKGYKFPELIYKAVNVIKKHVSTTTHLEFTANSHNQADPKESEDFDEPGVLINASILELIKSKFSTRPSLIRILESDMGGNHSLVYLAKQESLRCQVCYQSNFFARSQKYNFSRGLLGKKGLSINSAKDLAEKIVNHFISDEHSAVVNQRKYLEGGNAPKKPKISAPDDAKSRNSSSTPSNPPKFPLDGSSDPMEINEDTIKLIKSQLKFLSRTIMNILLKDSKVDRCLVYLPASKSIRCEICFRDEGIKVLNSRLGGVLVRESGMKDFNDYQMAGIINDHLNSQRHIQILLKRNGSDQKESFPIESTSLINSAVKIEPEVDPFKDISSPALAHSSVDLKPELPNSSVQNEDEFSPGELLQVKMEESEDHINSQATFKPKPSSETEDSSKEEDGRAPTGKYKGVFFKDVMEEFIKKHKPNPTLLNLLKSEPSLRYLPQLGSVRCEPCYFGTRKNKELKRTHKLGSKMGYKLPIRSNELPFIIKKHLNTTKHIQFYANFDIHHNKPEIKKIVDLNGAKSGNSSTPSNPSISPLDGSNPMNFGGSDQNGADQIEIPGIVIESVDIKEEPGI